MKSSFYQNKQYGQPLLRKVTKTELPKTPTSESDNDDSSISSFTW